MRVYPVLLVFGAMTLCGCTRESPPGGPGDKKVTTRTSQRDDTKTTTIREGEARDREFKVEVPAGATNITQGKREEITISLDRGRNFKEPVKVKIEAPMGIKAIPAETTIAADDNRTKVLFEAAPDAPVGRHTINVTGIPETGSPTSVNMEVDVKKKDT